MPCYHPMRAHQVAPGAQPRVLKKTDLHSPWNMKLPCANCIGCRLERSKQWAVRLMHEAQLQPNNSFITLTYNQESLTKGRPTWEPTVPYTPPSERARTGVGHDTAHETRTQVDSLLMRDAQLFMKRLRKLKANQEGATKVRFYLVGEYGDKNGRPHYHAAIYGEDFAADRYAAGKSPSGEQLYRSPTLEKLWPHGYSSVGDLTFKSAAYIARYIMKKINGKKADSHYQRVDSRGEVYYITPEFALMSRRPGIGKEWIDRWGTDVYPHDYVVMNGAKHKPPRYYDKLFELIDKEGAVLMKLDREFSARSQEADNTPLRLRAKERVAQARAAQSKRTLEK